MKHKIIVCICMIMMVLTLFVGLFAIMYGLLADSMFAVLCGIGLAGISAYIYEKYLWFLDRIKDGRA